MQKEVLYNQKDESHYQKEVSHYRTGNPTCDWHRTIRKRYRTIALAQLGFPITFVIASPIPYAFPGLQDARVIRPLCANESAAAIDGAGGSKVSGHA